MSRRLQFVIPLASWGIALFIGYGLAISNLSAPEYESSSSVYILGPAKTLLSQGLYKRADIYFHKGAQYVKDEAFQSIFQKWENAIHPQEHAHTSGNETLEIMPWLRLASKTDPKNIEIFLVASFWFSQDANRPDLSLGVIQEALSKNPQRHELYLEKGRIYLQLQEYGNAIQSLETSLKLIQTAKPEDQEQAAIDLPFIQLALSFLYETESDLNKAVSHMDSYLELNPEASQKYEQRIQELSESRLDPEKAKAFLKLHFAKEHHCDRDDIDEHDCDHHDHSACDHEEHVHGPHCNH